MGIVDLDHLAYYREVMHLRGIDEPEDLCPACDGFGARLYPNTATWRGGVGGSTPTQGVCDRCWGSGHRHKPWPSHREFEELRHRIAGLEK